MTPLAPGAPGAGRERIAVVGAGVSGLTAAHVLSRRHDVTARTLSASTRRCVVCGSSTSHYCEAGFAMHYLDVAQIRLARKEG
jgi:predicted NAD/FAD-binding protein